MIVAATVELTEKSVEEMKINGYDTSNEDRKEGSVWDFNRDEVLSNFVKGGYKKIKLNASTGCREELLNLFRIFTDGVKKMPTNMAVTSIGRKTKTYSRFATSFPIRYNINYTVEDSWIYPEPKYLPLFDYLSRASHFGQTCSISYKEPHTISIEFNNIQYISSGETMQVLLHIFNVILGYMRDWTSKDATLPKYSLSLEGNLSVDNIGDVIMDAFNRGRFGLAYFYMFEDYKNRNLVASYGFNGIESFYANKTLTQLQLLKLVAFMESVGWTTLPEYISIKLIAETNKPQNMLYVHALSQLSVIPDEIKKAIEATKSYINLTSSMSYMTKDYKVTIKDNPNYDSVYYEQYGDEEDWDEDDYDDEDED